MKKLAFAVAAIAFALASVQASAETTLSAKKKRVAARVQQQIACTWAGCHRIPSHCYPTMGYTWDGLPSGFDVVVCRRR